MKNVVLVLLFLFTGTAWAEELFYLNGGDIHRLIPAEPGIEEDGMTDYYRTEKGVLVGVRDQIILSLRPGAALGELLDRFPVTLLKPLGGGDYLLQLPSRSLTLSVANMLSEEAGVASAQPDFVKRVLPR